MLLFITLNQLVLTFESMDESYRALRFDALYVFQDFFLAKSGMFFQFTTKSPQFRPCFLAVLGTDAQEPRKANRTRGAISHVPSRASLLISARSAGHTSRYQSRELFS